jgi:inner membrane protein
LDNITHSLTGWALGQAGLKQKTRKGLAALILAANAPDIDVFFQWAPWEPLATHRGVSHSLIGGVLVLPPLLAGLLLLLDRWQVKRGVRFKSGLAMHPLWLLGLCYTGALSHSLLDLQTTYSVQLLSPLSGRWFHTDSLFIIDASLWLLMIFGIAMSQGIEQRGGRNYGRPVQAVLAIAFVYICFNLGLSDTATAAVRKRDPAATAIFASPPPMAFWKRDMVWRVGDEIGRAKWRMFGGLTPSEPLAADNMLDSIVRAALQRDWRLRKFLYWSVLPIAQVERHGCTARVVIADARYGLPARNKARVYRESTVDLCTSGRLAKDRTSGE